MQVIPLGNGKGVSWDPTTELQCARCGQSFDPATSLKSIYLMCDGSHSNGVQRPKIREYWYFHAECRDIEKTLKELGANIQWEAWSMPEILGFTIERNGFRRRGKWSDDRPSMFVSGLYETFYAQWRPALGGLDTEVTSTVDITSITTNSHGPLLAPALPPAVPHTPVDQKPGWLALRYAILARDKYRCRICGTAASDGPHVRLEVDHIVSRARGGTDEPSNLHTLCFDCNRGKGVNDL